MANLFDRVKETSTTTGTGDFTLAGAVASYRTFNTAAGTNNSVHYAIENPSDGTWEAGVGTLSSSTTLVRTTITGNSSGSSAPINFAAGTKYVYIDASAASLPAQQGSNYYMPPGEPGGRLSLTSGTAVTTSDVAASSTVYYVAYKNGVCPIYDGTRWQQCTFSNASSVLSPTSQTTRSCTVTSSSTTLTLTSGNTTGLYVGQLMTGTGVTNFGQYIKSIDSSSTLTMSVAGTSSVGATVTFYAPNYDIFATNSSGTVALEQLAWTDNTTRGTALTTQDGRLVKSGDATRLYLGTVRATGMTQFSDTAAQRFVFNNYNQVRRKVAKYESTASWTYGTGVTNAWRNFNNTINNRCEWFDGLGTLAVELNASTRVYVANGYTGNNFGRLGIGIDVSGSTTPTRNTLAYMLGSLFDLNPIVNYNGYPGIGYHFAQVQEFIFDTLCALQYHGTSDGQGGIQGTLTI